MTPDRLVLYRGPSLLDGAPIVAVSAALGRASGNRKTGDMVQVYVMRSDVPPTQGIKEGQDASVCGSCMHRSRASGGAGSCYVNTVRGPLPVWKAWKKTEAGPTDPTMLQHLLKYRVLRLTAYGDPSAVPLHVWDQAIAASRGHTGYTHEWATLLPEWQRHFMASVDTDLERELAVEQGWRTFRTMLRSEDLAPAERQCPATEEGGFLANCAHCRKCDGLTKGAKRPSIGLYVHGNQGDVNSYIRARVALSATTS
mgnify:CR=1 FL=1